MTGELPSGWALTRIENVANLLRGVTFKKAEASSEPGQGLVPIARAGNIEGDRVYLDRDLVYVPSERVADEQYLRSGDTLLATSSGSLSVVGKSALVTHDWHGAHGAFMAVLRPCSDLEPAFLGYFVQSGYVRRKWRQAAAGTNINNLKKPDVLSTEIVICPSEEQRRVVAAIDEHFSRLDATDTALAAAQRRLDALRRSAAAELFDRPEWTWSTLGEIADLKGGVTKDSKREADPDYVEYPYLRVANVQRGFLDLSVVTTIRAHRDKAEKLVLQHGDILFNEGGDRDKLGRGWVWEGQIENCIHQNHVFRARLTNGGFDPYFISMHANTWGQRWFEKHGKQTTNLASINLATLKSFPVPAPSLEDQQAVVAELRSITTSEERLRTDLERAERHSRTLRRSILSRAFSGQLVPQDRNDEPASVLLERIAASRATTPKRRKVDA